MAEEKNKKKKSRKKLLKIVIPAAAVAAIAAALILVLFVPQPENKQELETTVRASVKDYVDNDNIHQLGPEINSNGELKENGEGALLSYIPRNIKTVKIKNTKSSFTIKSYTPTEITTDEEGNETETTDATQYTLAGYEDCELQPGQADIIASEASALEFKKIVSVDGKNSKDFGFDAPRSTANITYQDNTKAKIIVGDEAPTNAGTYIKFGTGDAIYLVETDSVKSLLFSINDLISLTVTDSAQDGDSAAAESIELKGTAFEDTIKIVASDDESASTNYLITSPASYYGDDSNCSEIEAGIRGVYADSVVYAKPGREQIKKYGLSTPYACVTAVYPDVTVSLLASKPDDKGYCYIMTKGGNVIYRILSDSVRWTEKTLDDLRSCYFVDNTLESLSGAKVEFGNKSYDFSLNTTSKKYTDDNGIEQTSKSTAVKCGGKKVSQGSFQTAFDYMHGEYFMRNDFTHENLSGSPIMTITFSYSSNMARSQDVMRFYDLGKQKIYITVNGEQISYLTKNTVTDLQRLFTTAAKSSPNDDNG